LLSCQVTDLLALLDSKIGDVFVLSIDQFLVLGINERDEEGNAGSEEGESPGWEELDKVVAGE